MDGGQSFAAFNTLGLKNITGAIATD